MTSPQDEAWAALAQAVASEPSAHVRVPADRWSRAPQLEPASIASFSRCALELLTIAAPPALVESAHHAAIDELLRARLSLRITSTLRGQGLGPGPLRLDGVALTRPLEAFALSTVLEGCVIETIAAAVASTAAGLAAFAPVRAALVTLSRDELSHAQLAFSVVGWAPERHGERLWAPLRSQVGPRLRELEVQAGSPAAGGAGPVEVRPAERRRGPRGASSDGRARRAPGAG
ncbi:MAG: hypothetical protein INH41_02165 [Myxococcaceae bacterium]|nr:hypothetical protein [Myxococcaceae bacterium]MCA3011184.1 hypothetical protein [Myxococcaceae bacterium]